MLATGKRPELSDAALARIQRQLGIALTFERIDADHHGLLVTSIIDGAFAEAVASSWCGEFNNQESNSLLVLYPSSNLNYGSSYKALYIFNIAMKHMAITGHTTTGRMEDIVPIRTDDSKSIYVFMKDTCHRKIVLCQPDVSFDILAKDWPGAPDPNLQNYLNLVKESPKSLSEALARDIDTGDAVGLVGQLEEITTIATRRRIKFLLEFNPSFKRSWRYTVKSASHDDLRLFQGTHTFERAVESLLGYLRYLDRSSPSERTP